MLKLRVALVECDGQAVRLVNPNPDMRNVVKDGLLAGKVEMCLNGRFRTICDDSWTNHEASLLCKDLGFSEFGMGLHGAYFSSTFKQKHTHMYRNTCTHA